MHLKNVILSEDLVLQEQRLLKQVMTAKQVAEKTGLPLSQVEGTQKKA